MDEYIQSCTDILTGDSNNIAEISAQFNEKCYTKYDLVRAVRKMMMDIRAVPETILKQPDFVEHVSVYEN